MKKIDKLLIANRGEIAIRIIRTCREMGIKAVAIYSQIDQTAYHTRMADEAYFVGPPPAQESYLQQDRIIEIARDCGAQAIHPGYGFLAENANFAEKVAAAGLIFVGPPAEAMCIMGDKTAARKAMKKAGVPIIPGSAEPVATPEEAIEIAGKIGYPILLKAAAGGGGKGMRIVPSTTEMADSFRAAASESRSAFADDRIFIEKYLEKPRHIEFQILADQHGHTLHLGERECSIQRRHQKVIEESPSAIMTEELRQQMGTAAVKAATACGYTNAGTIEFLMDKNHQFYFLEMNTRLQVEHPVTEMVVGLDLVRLQLEIAAGIPLPFQQSDIQFHGHAIECRVYAEDPENNFLPSTGKITYFQTPDGAGTRNDSGVTSGDEISVYYDPMIAKLVVQAPTRKQAIQRMLRALYEYRILGVQTTIPFCTWVMQQKKFRRGDFDTHFVQEEYLPKKKNRSHNLSEAEMHAAAIAAAYALETEQNLHGTVQELHNHPPASAWRIRGWKQFRVP